MTDFLRKSPIGGRTLLVIALVVLAMATFATIFSAERTHEKPPPVIGFITLGDIHTPGWNKSQYDGIRIACESFGAKLVYRDNVLEGNGAVIEAIRELKAEGAEMIYLASYKYAYEAVDEIENTPEIAFATCVYAPNISNLTSHYVRMCQGRYMAGALAGLRTKTNALGYVAAEMTPETIRELNAYTIGARSVNPNVTVYVSWTGGWLNEPQEKENTRKLVYDKGVDVLTYHQDDLAVANVAEAMGVDYIAFNTRLTNHSAHYLGSVVCRWDIYYKNILGKYFKGELAAIKDNWIGMGEGAIWLMDVPEHIGLDVGYGVVEARRKLENKYPVFHGPLRDINGVERVGVGEVFTDASLIKDMDWLVEGIVALEK